jgi:hypothetical protein
MKKRKLRRYRLCGYRKEPRNKRFLLERATLYKGRRKKRKERETKK